MCGIYGMVAVRGVLRWPERADRLAAAVQARGPDAHGRHATPTAQIGVHRLRVVDLRPTADQPFAGDCRVLAFNGEVYNAADLRGRFPDHPWCSHTDGEVLLPLLAREGPAGLRAVAGMFALACWHAASRTLLLARDPAGEKPLFYAAGGHEVWFASSQDALRHHPRCSAALDLEAARDLLALGVVRDPRTLHSGIRSVPPGTALVFSEGTVQTLPYGPEAPARRPVPPREVAQALDAAVARQVRADVPLGVFLSGGIDSSLVAQVAARHRPGLPAFTVGFPDRSFDERPAATRAAAHLGLRLTTVEATTADLLAAWDKALALPEPVADPAVLPTILLAERARQEVTVVLSGEGADELFGGYPTYLGHRLAGTLPAALAAPLRYLLPRGTRGTRMPAAWLVRRFLEERAMPLADRHVAWFAGALPASALTSPRAVRVPPADGALAAVMELDRTLWLPARLLTKLDRATMRVALEARAPFLDPAVVALARATDPAAHGWRGKRLLRRVARTRLPSYILRRAKRGLSVPVGALLNGPLRAETDRLLATGRLARLGLVEPGAVARLLAEHRRGAEHGRALWTLLTFEAWRERHGLDA